MPIPFKKITQEELSPAATQHMVRMRDGARLATDVYLPESWDNGPVILSRLPYDKNSRYVFFDRIAALFNARGYAVAVQDVRGKFRSEGQTTAAIHEVHDGYDTIEWITRQGWSDGRVGMFGDSYYGYTQWAAVASEHPALRAIVPRTTGVDIGRFTGPEANADGKSRRLTSLWLYVYLSKVWVDRHSYEFSPNFTLRPISAVFEDIFTTLGARSRYFDLLRSAAPDIRLFPARHPFDTKPIPVLHVAGWFDSIIKEMSIGDFLKLSARPAWSPLQHLYVDSIDHENYRLCDVPITEATDHGVNASALARMLTRYVNPAADFFDVYLSEREPVSSLPRVSWSLGHGPDEMQESETWPPAGAAIQNFYLARAQDATGSADGGILATEPQPESTVTWTHDPCNLVPGTIKNPFAQLLERPDESPVSARSDVLTFTSPVLTSDLDLAGPAEVSLQVSSTAPTTDIVAKLLDVAPESDATLVAWGNAQIETAGQSPEFTVDLSHIGYRMRAGHRLRLQLASSEFPDFLPNSGTAESSWSSAELKSSDQTLTCGPQAILRLTTLRSEADKPQGNDRHQ